MSIEQVVNALGLVKQGKMYRHPSERTASIYIYPKTQSFCDFGRNIGGDAIKLWSYIRGVNNWQACREITAAFNLNVPNTVANAQSVRQAEQQRQLHLKQQQAEKTRWRSDVDRLKAEVEMYEQLLQSPHCEPMSALWCICMNKLQIANGKLDLLCGIN